jgi:retinol-binding protein 3
MRSPVLVLVASLYFGVPQAALASNQAPAHAPAAAPAETLDAAARKRVIDTAIAKMTEGYVFPQKVPAIAKALRSGLAGKYRAIGDPKAFADAVNADMEPVANDRHLRLMWSPEPLPPPPDPGKIDPAMRAKFHEFMAQHNYALREVQILDGNIGYLKINGFLPAEDAGPTLAAAMGFLKNSDALIIDLRDNGGGDPQGVAMLVSYLEPPETLINTFHERDKAVNDQIWTAPYVPGGRWSTDKPVYVLTSKNTASGAEEFAYDMQQLKRGTVVGSSTWGGANPGKIEPIDDHFAIFVPFGMAVNPISKTNWEGVGVKPDVAVAPANALETAKHLALQKLLEGATGERRAELQDLLAGKPAHSPH